MTAYNWNCYHIDDMNNDNGDEFLHNLKQHVCLSAFNIGYNLLNVYLNTQEQFKYEITIFKEN